MWMIFDSSDIKFNLIIIWFSFRLYHGWAIKIVYLHYQRNLKCHVKAVAELSQQFSYFSFYLKSFSLICFYFSSYCTINLYILIHIIQYLYYILYLKSEWWTEEISLNKSIVVLIARKSIPKMSCGSIALDITEMKTWKSYVLFVFINTNWMWNAEKANQILVILVLRYFTHPKKIQ